MAGRETTFNVRNRAFRSARGFTLIEAFICLAILVLIATIGLPVLTEVTNRRQAEGAAERVASDLREARSMALRLGTMYQLRSGNDGTMPGQYRIEWNDPTTGVLRTAPWYALSTDYRGGSLGNIDSGGVPRFSIGFNARGTTSGQFSIIVTAQNRTRVVQVERNGSIAVLEP
jgi:type II secretory pathway pseudopilin PulG